MPPLSAAFDGIEVGDELIVIAWFHRADRSVLQTRPRSDPRNPMTGVFATRSPDRPEPTRPPPRHGVARSRATGCASARSRRSTARRSSTSSRRSSSARFAARPLASPAARRRHDPHVASMRLRASLVVCALFTATAATAAADGPVKNARSSWPRRRTSTWFPTQPNFVMVVAPVDIRRIPRRGPLQLRGAEQRRRLHRRQRRVGRAAEAARDADARRGRRRSRRLGAGAALDPRLVEAGRLQRIRGRRRPRRTRATASSTTGRSSAISPLPWLRVGIALQRSRIFETPLDIQRGLFVSVTFRFATVSIYEFNAFWTTPTWVVALGVSF